MPSDSSVKSDANFVPQISQIYTDFSWDVFLVTQISQMTQIFFHRIPRNLFGGFLLRRSLTDFRGGDLFGRCRSPLGLDKAIHQRFHKKSVEICEICGTKKLPRRKICVICEICVTKNVPRKIMKQNPPRKTCETKEQREGEPRQLFLLGSQTNIEIAQLSWRHA